MGLSKMSNFHLLKILFSGLFIMKYAVGYPGLVANVTSVTARGSIALDIGPTRTPTPIGKHQPIVINYCPEQIGRDIHFCDDRDCGGDTKQAGFCDNIRLSGPQEACDAPGCGSYCQCTPTHDEHPISTDQIPFQICPEALGQPKKECSDCGGDTKLVGICDNVLLNGIQQGCPPAGCGYYCQCDNGEDTGSATPSGNPSSGNPPSGSPPSGSPTHLVTSVVNGQTVTATFQATTLSEWKDLKSHTTITTSVSSEETNRAIPIFAGGVAWWPIGRFCRGLVANRVILNLNLQGSQRLPVLFSYPRRWSRKAPKKTTSPAHLNPNATTQTVGGLMI